MADTNLPVTPGTGTNVDGYGLDNGNFRQTVVLGSSTTAAVVASVDSVKGLTTLAYQIPADQCQSVTAAISTGLTVTLPAVASQFHYITAITITQFSGLLTTGTATPVIVTTTNLPGSLAFTFPSALPAVGSISSQQNLVPAAPIKSSVAGTPTTIVAPLQTNVIWRITVNYYVAP